MGIRKCNVPSFQRKLFISFQICQRCYQNIYVQDWFSCSTFNEITWFIFHLSLSTTPKLVTVVQRLGFVLALSSFQIRSVIFSGDLKRGQKKRQVSLGLRRTSWNVNITIMHFFNSFSLGGIGIVGLLPGSWAGASGGILCFPVENIIKLVNIFNGQIKTNYHSTLTSLISLTTWGSISI